ncbi:hypothetical protein GGS23DRAFT_261476 [Durotheca rogersii]|uniref:uncharacterized protein n=1 Tax=Durotheca rogersii TaxID=419775 RepID=UPI00221FE36A|nr:uncharacterized protein GGS23DRAFT_261476 [Durotheca rogersii]KAI5859793.1 hypothetical protein GGS23DRAFT_261476 [Durotheca rogersii]
MRSSTPEFARPAIATLRDETSVDSLPDSPLIAARARSPASCQVEKRGGGGRQTWSWGFPLLPPSLPPSRPHTHIPTCLRTYLSTPTPVRPPLHTHTPRCMSARTERPPHRRAVLLSPPAPLARDGRQVIQRQRGKPARRCRRPTRRCRLPTSLPLAARAGRRDRAAAQGPRGDGETGLRRGSRSYPRCEGSCASERGRAVGSVCLSVCMSVSRTLLPPPPFAPPPLARWARARVRGRTQYLCRLGRRGPSSVPSWSQLGGTAAARQRDGKEKRKNRRKKSGLCEDDRRMRRSTDFFYFSCLPPFVVPPPPGGSRIRRYHRRRRCRTGVERGKRGGDGEARGCGWRRRRRRRRRG